MRTVRLIGVLVAVAVTWVTLSLLEPRVGYFYIAIAAVVLLPLAHCLRWSLAWPASGLAALAALLAVAPIDVIVRNTGRCEIALKPIGYGLGCDDSRYACVGCTVLDDDPGYALVVSY